MIYTPYTLEAMRLSYAAHHGQLDRAGAPYIFHLFHLAEQMKSEQAVCVALLHDVLEDTGLTERELAARFPEEVVRAVRLLTRFPGEDYFLYLGRIRENPLAREVKLCDLAHNLDRSRLAAAGLAPDSARVEKYERARAFLLGERE